MIFEIIGNKSKCMTLNLTSLKVEQCFGEVNKMKNKKKYFGSVLDKKVYWYGPEVETKCKLCAICREPLRRGKDKKYTFHLPVCNPCRDKSIERMKAFGVM